MTTTYLTKLNLLGLNKDKCIFITDKLKFFGIEIKNNNNNKNKIKAIKHAQVILVNLEVSLDYVHLFQGLLTVTVKKQLYFINYFKKIKSFLVRGNITKPLKN